jgi:hypothetical protein
MNISDSITHENKRINLYTGISDGLLIPFLISIISIPLINNNYLFAFYIGLLISLLGAIAFGIARYYSELEDISHNHPQLSKDETQKELELLKYLDIEEKIRNSINQEINSEKQLWFKNIHDNGLGWEYIDKKRALKSAGQTAYGFFAGGTLTCVLFLIPHYSGISIFYLLPIYGLFQGLFGYVQSRFLMNNTYQGVLRKLLFSGCALIIAFLLQYFIGYINS